MTRLVNMTILASALALASLSTSHVATAQEPTTMRKCIDCVPGGNGGPGSGTDQDDGYSGRRQKQYEQPGGQDGQDQGMPSKRKWKSPSDDQAEIGDDGPDQGMPTKRKWKPPQGGGQYQQGGNDDVVIDKKRVRQADRNKWKYDSNRHERRRYKDKKYRYYFGGFWYPYPYWDEPYYYIEPYRVSCREGAEIVSERFSRVRIVECGGSVFTYLGRRYGDTFEIRLSSRTGRILGAREI